MIRVLIVDDEELAREEMRFLLGQYDDIEVVAEAVDGAEAVRKAEDLEPDLMLLDVQMPGMDGFEVLERLGEMEIMPHIVFVTAYDEYAVQAFEVSALDYLMKPVAQERLNAALGRVRRQRSRDRGDLSQMADNATETRVRPPKLSIRKGDRFIVTDPKDITHGYIMDGVVFVATDKIAGITNHRTLEDLEDDLPEADFWRVHRSYVVNLNHVVEVIPWQSGTYRLRLDDEEGTLVPLSRAQARKMRKVLKW